MEGQATKGEIADNKDIERSAINCVDRQNGSVEEKGGKSLKR